MLLDDDHHEDTMLKNYQSLVCALDYFWTSALLSSWVLF